MNITLRIKIVKKDKDNVVIFITWLYNFPHSLHYRVRCEYLSTLANPFNTINTEHYLTVDVKTLIDMV